MAPECLPTTTSTTSTTATTSSRPPKPKTEVTGPTSSSVVLSHLQTSQQAGGGVSVQTLVGVLTGSFVILAVLVVIILTLVVRKHNYLQNCSRSEDYILHSEEPVVAHNIPVPPPLPPSPLHLPDQGHLQHGDRELLVPGLDPVHPAWLDEIQNNPMFNRQKDKLDTEGPLRSISGVMEQMENDMLVHGERRANTDSDSDRDEESEM